MFGYIKTFTICVLGFIIFSSIHGKNCYFNSYGRYTYYYPVTPTEINVTECELKESDRMVLSKLGTKYWSLETLPLYLFDGTNVQEIDSKSAGILFLHDGIFQPIKHSLKKIDMDKNLFDSFPYAAFVGLTDLQMVTMRFQGTGMKRCYFPPEMRLTSLSKIDLSGNKLMSAEFYDLGNENVLTLVLDLNDLIMLDLTGLHRIERFSAKDNKLLEIAESSFFNSRNTLKHIALTNNNLTERIWESLSWTHYLETIDVGGNSISSIKPSIINAQSNLKYLDVSRNSIKSIEGIRLRSGVMTHLFLHGNNFKSIPLDFLSMSSFKDPWSGVLDLSENELQGIISIPIPRCNGNCHINMSKNIINDLAFQLYPDTELDLLNISHNRLERLHSHFPLARHYDISHNLFQTKNILQTITGIFGMAEKLEIENVGLFCENDGISMEDDVVFDFDNLKHLNLKNNCVPLEFLCRIKVGEVNDLIYIILDNNNVRYTATSCSIFTDNRTSYSMNNMKFEGRNHMNLLLNNMSVLSKPFTSLLLSDNRLSEIPSMFLFYDLNMRYYVFNHLALNFSGNELETIPNLTVNLGDENSRYYLRGTTAFNFANNKITKINNIQINYRIDGVYDHNLIFNLSKNLLSVVHGNINIDYVHHPWSRWSNIYIDFSYNSIKYLDQNNFLPISDDTYINLHMNFSKNQLTALPDCNHTITKLRLYLDVSHNFITQLRGCRTTNTLNIGYNKISYIEADFEGQNLLTLHLEHNSITTVHILAFNLSTQIRTLHLHGNLLQEIPEAIAKTKYIRYLDLSLNNITILKNVHLLKSFQHLQTLILTGNGFIVVKEGISNPIFSLGLHCDCSLLPLRNYSWEVVGRCNSPLEARGYHVSCFPMNACPRSEPLYVHPDTIAKCRNDDYKDFTLAYESNGSVPVIVYRQTGVVMQSYLNVELFSQNKSIERQGVYYNDVIYTFISSKISESDFVCITATYNTNASLRKCLVLPMTKTLESTATINVEGVTLGSFLVVSLIVNIITVFIILKHCRRKTDKTSSPNATNKPNPSTSKIKDAENQEGHFYEGLSYPTQNTVINTVVSNLQTSTRRKRKDNEYEMSTIEVKAESNYVNSAFD